MSNYSTCYTIMVGENEKKEQCVLICKEKYGQWDFLGGGKKDDIDNNNPYQTAAREFWEESCGLFGDNINEIKKILHYYNKSGPYGSNGNTLYFIYGYKTIEYSAKHLNRAIQWLQQCDTFKKMKSDCTEILQVAWIPYKELLNQIIANGVSTKDNLWKAKDSIDIKYKGKTYPFRKRVAFDLLHIFEKRGTDVFPIKF